jgi:hypothetical protein
LIKIETKTKTDKQMLRARMGEERNKFKNVNENINDFNFAFSCNVLVMEYQFDG